MTDIAGELGGMSLTPAGNPYHLVDDAWVSFGTVFEAQPGTEIYVTGYYEIRIFGIIISHGTKYASAQPDPTKGDWAGIRFENLDPSSEFGANEVRDASYGLWWNASHESIGMSGNQIYSNNVGLFYYRRPNWMGGW